MSQQQPRRLQEPIKYGDVFPVSGDLAKDPIAPEDAAMMQSAENLVLGQTQKGGAASVMQSAADRNERAGLVGHTDVSDVAADEGMKVTETNIPGRRIITEYVAGQVVNQYTQATPLIATPPVTVATIQCDSITIGEALEAAALSCGDKPIDQSNAAAIQSAEMRATGRNAITPGGVGATAQSAATANERMMFDENKTTLSDVLMDATGQLSADKVATRQDAEEVINAELRNDPSLATHPGGVAASVAAAARLNQDM